MTRRPPACAWQAASFEALCHGADAVLPEVGSSSRHSMDGSEFAKLGFMHGTSSAVRRQASEPRVLLLEPLVLAKLLERWALKREKVLALLDPRAARRARGLISRCESLAALGFHPAGEHQSRDPLAVEWRDIRIDVATLLAGESEPEPASGPIRQKLA